MHQVFFSYSRGDSDFVSQLKGELESRGVDVWIDTGEILAGAAWRHSIVEAIRGCQVFVIVLSPRSVKSENVTKELTLAEQYDKRVVPLVMQEVEIPPSLDYQLAGLHYQNFAEGDYEDNFERLVRTLRSLGLNVRPKPEPAKDGSVAVADADKPDQKVGSGDKRPRTHEASDRRLSRAQRVPVLEEGRRQVGHLAGFHGRRRHDVGLLRREPLPRRPRVPARDHRLQLR